VLPDWPLVTAADAGGHWRPSGWQIVASDEQKLLYVLMQPGAHEGTHKDPATEVWVYNVATKTRVKRLRLVRPGSSISLTHGAEPLLLVQAGERLDVYEPQGGAWCAVWICPDSIRACKSSRHIDMGPIDKLEVSCCSVRSSRPFSRCCSQRRRFTNG
jgi:hypothetical protein